MERIGFLENKIKEQNEEHRDDNRKLMEIISQSKDIFKNIFDSKESGTSNLDTTADTNLETVGTNLDSTIRTNLDTTIGTLTEKSKQSSDQGN